jgi:putative DNA primase/helicase
VTDRRRRTGAKSLKCSDLGNAQRLVAAHGADLRYLVQHKRWVVWDGKRFRPDETHEINRRAKDTVGKICKEAAAAIDSKDRETLGKWATRSESAAGIRDMISLATSEASIAVKETELDADPWCFNVLNGTLDLRTGELGPHRREDLITKLAPIAYDPEAQCPQWLAFLTRIFNGQTDLVRFVQLAIGYSLTGSVEEQVLFFLLGTGANGKTRLLETLRRLLGDYSVQADFSTFTEHHGNSVRNDLARLCGARLVIASEANEGKPLDETVIKQLTGGDTIAARFLYSEYFEYRPQFKLWLAANHPPKVRSIGEAIWRRIRVVPFEITIPEIERDPRLGDKLATELPGILRWAVDGCLAWQLEGLQTPTAISTATGQRRDDMDALAGFINDCCTSDQLASVTARLLYEAYRKWANENGESAISQTAFGLRLGERPGLWKTRGTSKGGVVWHGLRLLKDLTGSDGFAGIQPISLSVTGTNRKTLQYPSASQFQPPPQFQVQRQLEAGNTHGGPA